MSFLKEKYQNKINIAVTGVTGFIGKHFVRYAEQNLDANIYAIVRQSSDLSELRSDGLNLVFYDGTFASLNDFFSKKKIDAVVHLAGFVKAEHKSSDIDNLIDSNIKFGCHLLEAACGNNCRSFVNIGTYFQNYFSEEYYPSSIYAATKQSMQNIIDYYVINQDLNAITLKLFDTYGPNDSRKKILNLFKEYQESGKELKMSPGEQEIRLVYIDDVLEALMTALNLVKNSQGHKIYYVGSKAYKLREVAKIFEEVTAAKLNINWGALPYRKNQPLKSYIGELLPNWESKTDLRDGIRKFLGL